MSAGAMLRHARVTKGLTRDEIAAATRIPLRLIAAIEQEDWAALPGGIFTRGYLRAYGSEVGLDPGVLLAEYRAAVAPPPVEPEADATEILPARPRENIVPFKEAIQRPWWRRMVLPIAALVLLLAYVQMRPGASVSQNTRPAGAVQQASSAGLTGASGQRGAEPVGTTASADDVSQPAVGGAAVPAADSPIVIDVAVTRPCWLSVKVDGRVEVYRLVRPGERPRLEGREILMRAGDAGAVDLTIDGRPAKPIGSSGAVVTVRIARDTYRSLLAEHGRP